MPRLDPCKWEAEMLLLWHKLSRIADDVFPTGDDGRFLTIETKGTNDIVTSAEREIDSRLTEFLSLQFNCLVISEERPYDIWPPFQGYVWIIDPIDGTRNFSKRLTSFGIMGAYAENGIITAGFIFFPFAYGACRKMYFAWKSMGAWVMDKNGYRQIRTASNAPLQESFVFVEGPKHLRRSETHRIEEVAHRTRDNFSCAVAFHALAHSWPEETPAAGVISLRNKPWDNAPGCIIAEEAGCTVTDRMGHAVTIENCTDIIAANNRENHRRLLALVNKE